VKIHRVHIANPLNSGVQHFQADDSTDAQEKEQPFHFLQTKKTAGYNSQQSDSTLYLPVTFRLKKIINAAERKENAPDKITHAVLILALKLKDLPNDKPTIR
jgi:hypothetical protein